MRRALASLFLLLPAACGSAPQRQAPAEPPEFVQARAAIIRQLRDPQSASFGPLAIGRSGSVCGTVNARNGFGGYTGAEPFAWSSATGGLLYEFPSELGNWRERGELAERFEALGCSIGPDQGRAIAALRALEDSDQRLAGN